MKNHRYLRFSLRLCLFLIFCIMKNTTNPANEKGQEYKLPDGLQDDMLELNKEVKKSKDRTSIFSRPATYLTMLTTALTLQAVSPAFSQTDDKTPETKNVNLSTLDYTLLNVEKYYPDMKKHLQDMIGTIVTPKRKPLWTIFLITLSCKQATNNKK